MFRIAICDDIPEERERIRLVLKQGLDDCKMKAEIIEYESGAALLEAWEEAKLDLLFLDIYMSGPDGVETARSPPPAVCGRRAAR